MQVIKPTPSQAAFVLKKFLKESGFDIQVSKAQEAVARMNGFANWNALTSVMNPRVGEPKQQEGVLAQESCETDYELKKPYTACWIGVDNIDVHIVRTDEGVVVDLWPQHGAATECMASTYAYFDEARPDEEDSDDVEGNKASDKRQDSLIEQVITAEHLQTSETGCPVEILKKDLQALRNMHEGHEDRCDQAATVVEYKLLDGTKRGISLGSLLEASYLGETGWMLPSGNELWLYQALPAQETGKSPEKEEPAITLVHALLEAQSVDNQITGSGHPKLYLDDELLCTAREKGVAYLKSCEPQTKVLEFRNEYGTLVQVFVEDLLRATPAGTSGWTLPNGRYLCVR